MIDSIKPVVKNWKKPITIARHAYGDVYRNSEIRIPGAGKAELVFTGADGQEIRQTIFDFKGPGVVQGMHNLDASITSFAHACFQYALSVKQDLWFSTKDTISKTYDHRFKDIFQEIFDAQYKEKFEQAGITYFYTLIDDAVARVVRSKGGFIWACKNYDGDVMSDMVATAFGSKRGQLDDLPDLAAFADKLEKATIDTIESGVMTKDLALLWEGTPAQAVNSRTFLEAIASRMA